MSYWPWPQHCLYMYMQTVQHSIIMILVSPKVCFLAVVDVLIKIGGLNAIWELCGKTENPEVCQTCLYALACAVEISSKCFFIVSYDIET